MGNNDKSRKSNMPGWIFPAYRLMASLGYQTKFYLISFFTAVPMLLLSLVLMEDLFDSFRQNDVIRSRLKRVETLNELRWSLEDVRDLSVRRMLTPDDDVEAMYQRAQQIARERIAAIEPAAESPLREAEIGYLERVSEGLLLDQTPPGSEGFRLTQLFDNANGAIQVVQEWLVTIGKQGRTTSPDKAATQLEIDQINELVYRLSRNIGSLRAFGAELLGNDYLDSDGAEVIDVALNELERELQLLELKSSVAGLAGAAQVLDRTHETYLYVERTLINTIELKTPWHDFFAHLSDTLRTYRDFESNMHATLGEELRISAENGFNKLVGLGILLIATIMVYIYLMMGLYISVMKSVVSLASSAKRVARGDLESPIRCDSSDEMRIIGDSMEGMRQQLQVREKELREISLIDGLTGLRNRRYFDEALLGHFATARRQRSFIALVLIDLDHFKQINDQYGHAAGDQVLQNVAQIFRDFFRRERDVVARFGGEEFSIILPETSAEQALHLAEKLREKVENAVLHFEQFSIPVTLSAGVAVFDGYLPLSATLLMRAVDDALYRAKKSGRNQVVLAVGEEAAETSSIKASSAGGDEVVAAGVGTPGANGGAEVAHVKTPGGDDGAPAPDSDKGFGHHSSVNSGKIPPPAGVPAGEGAT